jgi:uncharacterized protein (TIGR02001 family)
METFNPLLLMSAAVIASTSATAGSPETNGSGVEGLRSRFEASGNVALVSDYRARGITVSDNDPAIQGGFDVSEASGWSAGVWASSMEEANGATMELDIYAARTFKVGESEIALGVTAYTYPGGDHLNYGEVLANVTQAIGPVDATVAVAYAWGQDTLGDADNFYVSLNGTTPVGRLGAVPVSLGGSLGYEDGALAVDDTKLDWSLSVTADIEAITIGLSYVDNDLENNGGDPAAVISIARSF